MGLRPATTLATAHRMTDLRRERTCHRDLVVWAMAATTRPAAKPSASVWGRTLPLRRVLCVGAENADDAERMLRPTRHATSLTSSPRSSPMMFMARIVTLRARCHRHDRPAADPGERERGRFRPYGRSHCFRWRIPSGMRERNGLVTTGRPPSDYRPRHQQMTEVGGVMGDRKTKWKGGRLTELTDRVSTGGGAGSGRRDGRHPRAGGHADDALRASDHLPGGSLTPTSRTLTGLLLVAALGACQEDLGSEDWLIVDNRTDSEVFVTDTGATGSSHLGSVRAGRAVSAPGPWTGATRAPWWPMPGRPRGRWLRAGLRRTARHA